MRGEYLIDNLPYIFIMIGKSWKKGLGVTATNSALHHFEQWHPAIYRFELGREPDP